MRILHTMLRTGNLERSIQFYTEVLGMKLLRQKEYPDGKFTLAFIGYGGEHDNTVIELTYNWGVERYELGTGFGHIAIEVDDVYKAADEIKTAWRQNPARGRSDERRHHHHRLRRRPGWLSHRADRQETLIQWTTHPASALVQYMRVDHGGTHILVPQQFLHGADVIAVVQQVCGEAMAQGMHRNVRG